MKDQILEEGKTQLPKDGPDMPLPRGRKRERTNDRSPKKRKNHSSRDSSSSTSGWSSHGRFRRKRKKSPSPPSSPSSSNDEVSSMPSSAPHKDKHKRRKHSAWKRSKKLQKFKEGGKNVTFLIYDGTYGDTDKVLNFIQQFDAAFEGEPFTDDSKLCNVTMYLQKTTRQWWAILRSQGLAPKTWSQMRVSIMKQFKLKTMFLLLGKVSS